MGRGWEGDGKGMGREQELEKTRCTFYVLFITKKTLLQYLFYYAYPFE
jgi:hypothetical protein